LRDTIVERLKAAGYRLATSEDEAADLGPPPGILVHLEAGIGVTGSQPTDGGAEVQAIYDLIERASKPMASARFGRIVLLRAGPPHAGCALDTYRLAGMVAVVAETARRLAPAGITLNIVSLHPPRLETGARAATEAEVAGLVRMLCDAEAGFVTAQCFPMLIAPV
jgi:hypothetical protein